jgi:hypothetical protein
MGKNNAGDPTAIANGHLIGQGIITQSENFAIEIPDIPELPEGYDIADNW